MDGIFALVNTFQDVAEQRFVTALNYWQAVLPPCFEMCSKTSRQQGCTLSLAYTKFTASALQHHAASNSNSLMKELIESIPSSALDSTTPLGSLNTETLNHLLHVMQQAELDLFKEPGDPATVFERLLSWMIHSPYSVWQIGTTSRSYAIQQQLYQLLYPNSPLALVAMRLNDSQHTKDEGVFELYRPQTEWLIDRYRLKAGRLGLGPPLEYWTVATMCWLEAYRLKPCTARCITARRMAMAAAGCVGWMLAGGTNKSGSIGEVFHSLLRLSWFVVHSQEASFVDLIKDLVRSIALVYGSSDTVNRSLFRHFEMLVVLIQTTGDPARVYTSYAEKPTQRITHDIANILQSARLRKQLKVSRLPRRAFRQGLVDIGKQTTREAMLVAFLAQSEILRNVHISVPIFPDETYDHWAARCRMYAPSVDVQTTMIRSLWSVGVSEQDRQLMRLESKKLLEAWMDHHTVVGQDHSIDHTWYLNQYDTSTTSLQHLKEYVLELIHKASGSRSSFAVWMACLPKYHELMVIVRASSLRRPGRRHSIRRRSRHRCRYCTKENNKFKQHPLRMDTGTM